MFIKFPSTLCRLLFIITFAFATALLLIFSVFAPKTLIIKSPIACYHIKDASLIDISDTNPIKGKSIFFHETSCNSYKNGKIIISSRQACAVESAARMNSNSDVYLLYSSPGIIKYENTTSDNFLKALSTYNNVKIYHLDYERYTRNTPLEELYESGKVELSKYALSHASDVLRYLTLWKYGGTYLDLDVIVIKSLDDLMENYAGSESDTAIAAGILNFAPAGKGHEYAEMCVADLKNHFKGNLWGNNGPGVITRVLQKLCQTKKANEMLHKNCSGFKVYPSEKFYPVHWTDWKIYFNPKYNKKIFNITKNSYLVHVWNNHSKNKKINIKLDVPYSILAKKYCPEVFSKCKGFF